MSLNKHTALDDNKFMLLRETERKKLHATMNWASQKEETEVGGLGPDFARVIYNVLGH